MNIKKMFTTLSAMVVAVTMTMPSVSVFGAEYSQELQDAYDWAYSKGVTTMSPIDNANMYGAITRAEMAKMLSVYSTEVLGNTPDTSKACTFTDIDSVKGDLHDFIIESCQLGIMGQGITAFRPYDTISRAEFGTALSRVLWGSEYEGGTPYYANHLNALKSAGIMTQIANAESTKEIRGWVMLMLMRSEEGGVAVDCEDPAIALACLDPELDTYKNCPAACREDANQDNTVVKSGDLAVKVTPATERKAIVNGVSDLDTITLKASEKITVNSITLERFGYSTANDVDVVWLEDGNGNKIADEKSLSTSKDTVTLKIKKEYRDMEDSNALTIVLKTTKDAKAGGTIGFKVIDVDASAKNLDLSDYNPYTYELVNYEGAEVTVSVKGNDKSYNYEEGEYYEVSRLRVKAGASILALNGITLTNKGGNVTKEVTSGTAYTTTTCTGDDDWTAKIGDKEKENDKMKCIYTSKTSLTTLDLDEFVSKVKVTADGKEVSGLKYNVTKDNEIVLSWDTIDVAINKDVQLVVSIAMENLDEFGKVVRLVLNDTADLNAVEKKTGARVSVVAPKATDYSWKVYTFNGSKIKFVNTKLAATIDAAQGSQDVVIAKGTVTVGEEVKISELTFKASEANVIEEMTLTIGGETYDASTKDNENFTFKNVIIEKSGDLELAVSIVDEDKVTGKTISFTPVSIGKAIFENENGRYESSREYVYPADVSGTISLSKLKVQESKASLKNNDSATKEFVKGEPSEPTTVFKGTYTAKKNDITLNEFAIVGDATQLPNDTTAEFTIYVDGEPVGSIDESDIQPTPADDTKFDSYEDFSDDVEVAAGKSVEVEVKAVITPDGTQKNVKFDLYLRGDDKNGTEAGFAKAPLNTMNFVLNGSINVSDSTTMAKKTVVLQANEITMAKFTIKPSKSDSVALDNMVFKFRDGANTANITVSVDGQDLDVMDAPTGKYWTSTGEETTTDGKYVKYDGSNIPVDEELEVVVKVTGLTGVDKATINSGDAIKMTLESINGVAKKSEYTRLILPALVTFDTQVSDGAFTTFKVLVDDYDGDQISALEVTAAGGNNGGIAEIVTDGATFDIANDTNAQIVTKVVFKINDTNTVTLTNTDFPDYFKATDGKTLRVFQTKDA